MQIRHGVLVLFYIITTYQHGSDKKPISVFGCYHGGLGSFYWTISGDSLILNISAHVSEEDWIGIGFSEDSEMGNDDVVALHKDVNSETFTASSLLNPTDQITTIRQKMDSLVDMSVSYNDGIVEANLTKSISLSSPVNDLARFPVYLFFAKGPINKKDPSTPIHMHYALKVSRSPVFLSNSMPSCIAIKTDNLLKVHGFLMVVVWLNVTPLAIFIARYAKNFFKRQNAWLHIHKYSGFISGVAVIVSVSLAYLGVNREFELHRHQIIGVAVLAVLLFHLLLALCRPGPNNKYRPVWEIAHRVAAAVLLTASIVNIINGLFMLSVHQVCYWMISIQFTVWCLLYMAMENSQQVGKIMIRLHRLVCCPVNPTRYYSLGPRGSTGSRDINEDSNSDVDDITMVTIDLDTSATRVNFLKTGLWSLIVLNTVVVLTIGLALAGT